MSEHEFTPGPWSVGHTRKSSVSAFAHFETPVHVGSENRGNCLAIVYLGGPGAGDMSQGAIEANARLISSAPDLLEACERLLDGVDPHWATSEEGIAVVSKALAAIAKATGAAQ